MNLAISFQIIEEAQRNFNDEVRTKNFDQVKRLIIQSYLYVILSELKFH